MWLRRSKSTAPIHSDSTRFSCSSFKDVNTLFADGFNSDNKLKRSSSIIHRVNSVLPALKDSFPEEEAQSQSAPPLIPLPGAEKRIVVYFTSLRVIRKTFEDCKAVGSILRGFRVLIDERDVSMDSSLMSELQRILGLPEKTKLTLPRVFIGGRYIGGAKEIRRLNQSGELKRYVEGLAPAKPGTCEACGGYRFILCDECRGSHRCYKEKGGFKSCSFCNENGLIRCSSCSCASFSTFLPD